MSTENHDNDADRPTALIEREALLGLIDRSAEPERSRPHTVPRERVRLRAARPSELEIVEVSPLQRARGSAAGMPEPNPISRLLFAIIAVLVLTFVVAIQLR